MHFELLRLARQRVQPADGSMPSQIALKRAVSDGYYALFHYISDSCAIELAGGGEKMLTRAAEQIYRSLDHRDIAAACEKARIPSVGFPKEIVYIASLFLEMLRSRQKADYDRASSFVPKQVATMLADIETAFRVHAAAHKDDRRAFAILVAVKVPPRSRA